MRRTDLSSSSRVITTSREFVDRDLGQSTAENSPANSEDEIAFEHSIPNQRSPSVRLNNRRYRTRSNSSHSQSISTPTNGLCNGNAKISADTEDLDDLTPPAKKAKRMQVGVGNSSTTTTTTTSTSNGKSVGERLKEKQKANQAAKNSTNHATPSCSTAGRTSRTKIPTDIVKHNRPELNERQRNTIRVITQYLKDIGMNDTVETLADESGCRDENPLALRLRESIKTEKWADALNIVDSFKKEIDIKDYLTLRAALVEEMIKNYLAKGNFMAVLACIHQEYPTEKEYEARRQFYAQLLIEDPDEVKKCYDVKDEKPDYQYLISMMQDLLPANFLLAPNRLDDLLHQSYETQIRNCTLHIGKPKAPPDNMSILRDHCCTTLNFPTRTIQIIEDHETEVWVLKFSPCGEYLASAGKAGIVYIWKMREDERLGYAHRFVMNDDIDGVGSLSWSSDSRYLACGATEHRTIGVYLYDVREALNDTKTHKIVDPVKVNPDKFSVADFFPSKGHKLVCGDQKGNFAMFNVNEELKDKRNDFEGFRIRGLCCLKDGKTVLAADTLNRIRSYDFDKRIDQTLIEENSPIISFTVDTAERNCLVTTKDNGIRLWCLDTCTLVQSFFGSIHSELVVAACFGGVNDSFIASGSEKNNRIMIWKRSEQRPIKYLDGHRRGVNAVAWNPKYPTILVSGSDDHTIRIWSTSEKADEFKDALIPQQLGTLDRDLDDEDDDLPNGDAKPCKKTSSSDSSS